MSPGVPPTLHYPNEPSRRHQPVKCRQRPGLSAENPCMRMNQQLGKKQGGKNEQEEADGQCAPELDDAFASQGRLLAGVPHFATKPAAKQSKHAIQRKEDHRSEEHTSEL